MRRQRGRARGWSLASSLARGQKVLFPDARIQNFLNLRKSEITLLFSIIKVGRNTDAGLWTIVDQNLARQQFPADFVRVRAIDRDRAAAFGGIFRAINSPAARANAF